MSFAEWVRQPLQRQHSENNNTDAGCNIRGAKLNYTNGYSYLFDVFLGGSCKNSWRDNGTINLIKKHHLTYYNPAIRETNKSENLNSDIEFSDENNVIHWKRKMDGSRVLLFVITNDTRSLTSMILAAHYIGLDKNIVLCIQHLPNDELEIDNEKVCEVWICSSS